MFVVRTLNSISPAGLSKLPQNLYTLSQDNPQPDGILVRSADMHEMELNPNLLAIARAGAGVNNIPLDRCSQQGIVVFNTPGANSRSVAELVVGALVMGSRNLVPAAQWVQNLAGTTSAAALAKEVEKGKKQFIGPELKDKRLGVIGLGAIGVKVANMALALGMEVYGYDPYISVDAAWNLNRGVVHCVNLNDLLRKCDYVTLHVPMTPATRDTLNEKTLDSCKDGVRVLNFARGELVNNQAMLAALESGKVSCYLTDFPAPELLGVPGVICTPHLGASTPESEQNCAVMAAEELSDYLKNGNIRNSVNMPEVVQPRSGSRRICLIHKNAPGLISSITAVTTQAGLNIETMVNKSKKEMAYTLLDATGAVPADLAGQLAKIPSVIRVRIL